MARSAKRTDRQIRVRMYRVGFGDCFLMSLPKKEGRAHVLIDCGVHSAGDTKTIEAAVKDIGKETGGRIDIVIATHAHQDHISGFAKCAAAFSAMEVGEVWLPWTENGQDAQAARIRKKQLALIAALNLHFAARPPCEEAMFALQNLTGNAAALNLLKAGISGGKVRHLEAGQEIERPAGIPGLTVKVLGPPRDEAFLARMDPPAGDRYLRTGAGSRGAANAVEPFVHRDVKRGLLPRQLRLPAKLEKELRDEIERLDSLAFGIDQAVNNSSLVTLFSLGGQHLLFPGDAQYGSWQSWLDGPEGREILSQLTFMKMAHHASHNATPRRALEGMTDGQVSAMVSTQTKPWKSIPRGPLIEALDKKTRKRWVRSDSLALRNAPNAPARRLAKGFSKGELWFDYTVAV